MPCTENEAKFKYCPLLKTHDDKMKFCQGSMCMMWRAEKPGEEGSRGWCGLAGTPLALAGAQGGAGSGTQPPCQGRDPRKTEAKD